ICETTRYANLAHFGVSSQTWNNIYARKPLFGLTSALTPIHETWENDNNPAQSPNFGNEGNAQPRHRLTTTFRKGGFTDSDEPSDPDDGETP
ncbi:MAG TPA: hypothetical protein VG651_14685, partial [Stellaceae bacterium]|nr:hypothetical protein [Stellaceae bacterium]